LADSTRELAGEVVTDASGGRVYLVAPPAPSTMGVVVLYDVMGFDGGRTKQCCDALASMGFHVAMPDVYDGTDIKEKGGFGDPAAMAWLKGISDFDSLAPRITPSLSLLRSAGATKVGALGFCWGAYPAFKLSAAGLVQACVSCHPALKIGSMFFGESESETALASAVQCPQCLMPSGNDSVLLRDGTLSTLIEAAGFECEVLSFPGMEHGWVTRGDLSQPEVQRDCEAALQKAGAFFSTHLA